jgi:preprotein translocase SecE subunit
VAKSERGGKPRIRKSAPTVRQTIETAKNQPPKPKRETKPLRPRLNLHLPKNSFTSGLKKGFSYITPRYFINSWNEVRQVTWTSRRETWRLTLAVFIFAIIFGALVAGVDKGLDAIFKHTVLK